MAQMMSQMMGGSFGAAMLVGPLSLTISVIVVVIALVYVVLFPEIKSGIISTDPRGGMAEGLDAIMRFAKPDEGAVLGTLRSAGGACLQKDIRLKTGFSKLKTHRILVRLAERGIVVVKKQGKVNEVCLPEWLRGSPR